jgi:hypothetical protein
MEVLIMPEKTVFVFTILKDGNIEDITSTSNEDTINKKIQDFLKKYNFSSHDEYLKKIETDPSIKYTVQEHTAGRTRKLDDPPSIFSTAIREKSSPSIPTPTLNLDVSQKEASQRKEDVPKKQIQSTLF